MHFKMSSAIRFNLDQSKILLSGNGLTGIVDHGYALTLHQTYFLDWTKVNAFADDKLNVPKVTISVFDRVEMIVQTGKC